MCHQTQLPCAPVCAQKPILSVWPSFIHDIIHVGPTRKRKPSVLSELGIFWATRVFSDRALDSATTEVTEIYKAAKNPEPTLESSSCKYVKTHDDGLCTKYAAPGSALSFACVSPCVE